MTGKTKFIPAMTLTAGLVLGWVLYYQQDKRQTPTLTNEVTAAVPSPKATPSAKSPTPQTSSSPTSTHRAAKFDLDEPVDPRDWIANGPKEPLVPPELHVEAEPVPESVTTDEPLVPREIVIEADEVPGESVTNTPLTPREIHVDEPDP